MKKYRIIYCDPPWNFDCNIGSTGTNVKQHYKTMSIEELKRMDIKSISKKDSIIFMWVVDYYLKDAIDIMEKWGFKYKTIAFVWLKLNKNKKPVWNVGPYVGKSCEVCLLGTKGAVTKYIVERKKQFVATIRGRHSEKPEKVIERIEQMFDKSENKLELFARKKREGWDVFGDEVEDSIEVGFK